MKRTMRVALLFALFATGTASAGEGASSCHPYDATPPCCPHPPPQCCPADTSAPLDEASIVQICGGLTVKGEASGLNACNRYFTRGDRKVVVTYGREPGDAAVFAKRRADLSSPTGKTTTVSVAQTQAAFSLRELDDTGGIERSSVWALVGREIVHVEAEHVACDEAQVLKLLQRALERMHAGKPRG
jgi:hypothetical protein